MKANNKRIKNISKIKNAVLGDKKDPSYLKEVCLIEYYDHTYNIIDLKHNVDLTDLPIGIDKTKSKIKMIFSNIS